MARWAAAAILRDEEIEDGHCFGQLLACEEKILKVLHLHLLR